MCPTSLTVPKGESHAESQTRIQKRTSGQNPEAGQGLLGRPKLNYRTAKEAVEHALVYAYRDRRARSAISAACGSSGSRPAAMAQRGDLQPLHQRLEKTRDELDRKVLAELAVNAPETFAPDRAKVKDVLA